MATDDKPDHTQGTDEARRRLLKMALYVPPAILGVVSVSSCDGHTTSCGPNACPPESPCGPNACPPESGA